MKITSEMLPFIEKAMDEAITKAYPKTGGIASVRAKITMATLKGLEQQKESTLSRALFFASQAAEQCVHPTPPTARSISVTCPKCGTFIGVDFANTAGG